MKTITEKFNQLTEIETSQRLMRVDELSESDNDLIFRLLMFVYGIDLSGDNLEEVVNDAMNLRIMDLSLEFEIYYNYLINMGALDHVDAYFK